MGRWVTEYSPGFRDRIETLDIPVMSSPIIDRSVYSWPAQHIKVEMKVREATTIDGSPSINRGVSGRRPGLAGGQRPAADSNPPESEFNVAVFHNLSFEDELRVLNELAARGNRRRQRRDITPYRSDLQTAASANPNSTPLPSERWSPGTPSRHDTNCSASQPG